MKTQDISTTEGKTDLLNRNIAEKWSAWTPQFRSILRIVAGFLFIQFGTAKLLAFPASIMPDGSTVPIASLTGAASILEMVGGLFLLLGLFTRRVAFILAGEMAVAYFYGHAPLGFWPVLNHGVPAILFCFIYLYFSAAGAGPWSLDSLRKN